MSPMPLCFSSPHHIERLDFSHTLLTTFLHSLPNTMDEATPMKPKKAAEEGHVSELKSLMVARLII